MKPLCLLFASIIAFSFFSCSEDEAPSSPLIGTWESRVYNDSLEYWFVESYTFKNDSIFDLQRTVRQTETGPDLGYQLLSTSWYQLNGSVFKYYYSDALMYSPVQTDGVSLPYVPKEELRPAIVDLFRIPETTLTFSQDRRQFELLMDCFAGVNCSDPLKKIFVRAN